MISAGITVKISLKTFVFLFFFGDHIIFRTKQQHFLGLIWASQDQNSVIFELAPGPRSALGAPALKLNCYDQSKVWGAQIKKLTKEYDIPNMQY